jgi:gliding motility-associated-like protein
LATIGGNSYQWYKDGELIPGATDQTYQTDESGIFSVSVDLGSCQASGSIDLVSESFTASLNVSDETTLEEGETLNVIVTTTAINPEFEWYLNDVLITDATDDSFEINEFGDYSVVIYQTSGCIVSRELFFTINEPIEQFPNVANIPNLISPNGDGVNDTWVIPTDYVSGTETEVIIMTSQGKTVLQTNDYQNNWPENQLEFNSINPVYYYIITAPNQEPKKGSITIVK